MRVTPIPHGLDLLKSELVRGEGVHASGIYNDLYKSLEPGRFKEGEGPNPVLMMLGTAFEKHFEYLLRLNGVDAKRPREFISPEGIYYSPDLLIFNGEARVGEMKLTSMGLKECPKEETNWLPQKFDKYLTQMKFYAIHQGLSHARLYVCSIRQPWNPELMAFDIEFTDRELQENHQMLVNHAKLRGML
jgi:hypothetical protein